MNRKTSFEVVEKIKFFEGLRLKSYHCSANKLTIGYGHTKDVKENQTISIEQAEDLLNEDLKTYEKYVDNLEMKYGYSFTQNQFDALVSFFFNLGFVGGQLTNFGKRNIEEIASKIIQYCKYTNPKTGKKEVLKGLLVRREYEQKLFSKDVKPFEGTTCVKQKVDNIIKKATNVNNKYATGKKIYLKNVTMLSSDNCVTPIEYLENATVTFYGYYNKDTVTQYLLVKVDATGKTGYIKNNFVEL